MQGHGDDIYGASSPAASPMSTRYGASETGKDEERVDRELWTRDLCIVGLILGWGASLASISSAVYMLAADAVTIPPWLVSRAALIGPAGYSWLTPRGEYIRGQRVYGVSEAATIIVPLALQVAIALVSTCLDSIHSTTLRWTLWREGRLYHNVNLRLFTRAGGGPNAWPANVVSGLGLVLAFGGASVMVFPVTVFAAIQLNKADPDADPFVYDDAVIGPDRYGISFNGWGLLGLGVGLLLQSVISTWCLVYDSAGHIVGTWNSNPLATARACRSLMDEASAAKRVQVPRLIAKPALRQPSMSSLAPATRTITNWIWAVFALHSAFTVAVSIVAVKVQHSASLDFVRESQYPAPVDFASVWRLFGQVSVRYNPRVYSSYYEFAGLLMQCAALSTLLLGMHLADVLGGLARDEAIWQRATTRRGANPESNMLLETARNWPNGIILAFKAVVPWAFGYAFACSGNLYMAVFPLLTIAALFLALAVFAEYLVRAEPRRAQPATYGQVPALVALVDDWSHDTIFWGDKGSYRPIEGVRVAGTAGTRLPDLLPGVMYKGLSKGSHV